MLCLPSERGWFWYGLADPVSSGKYTWIFVFTAPVAELYVVSFTVPFNDWTIAATATVVISCSSSADMCCGSVCVAILCGGGVSWWCLRFCLGQCEADDWKFSFISSSSGRWVYCMLNGWFSSNDDFCPGSFFFSRFKLKDKRRSAKWEVYLDRAHDHQGGP